MKHRVITLVITLAFFDAQCALAQAYPNRPIRLVVASSPGGASDILARLLGQKLAEELAQQVVVDNRGGASGVIGTDIVAKATPDGYTLLFGFSGPLVIVPQLNAAGAPYDSQKDFAPISLTSAAPYVLLVNAQSPVKTVKDLIAAAKAQPDKFFYGSGGNGTGIHMAGALFIMVAGTNITHVPFKGAAPATTALIAGQVNMMFNSLPGAMAHMKAGRIRAVAMATAQRSSLYPDLPTITESSGLPFDATGWYGVLAPRATPKPIVARLHAEVIKALNSPATKDKMTAQGVETVGSTPQEFAARIREEWAKWGKVIAVAGLKQK